jgi:U4/U6 small nuclear ribonucleoprotein PRP31
VCFVIKENEEYQLIVSCNDLIVKIDEEMLTVYKYVASIYAKKFPELESLVPTRLDYLRTVTAIGNEMDLTMVDLSSTLPNAMVISVSMTGSTTSGRALSEADLGQCLQGCDEATKLDEAREAILSFVETRMTSVAPNLCALLDTSIAAQLMGLAGGLVSMSKIPACNLQVIGQVKNQAAGSGFGAAAGMPHTGIVYYSTVVQQAPPYLRRKALKVVAGKLALAARIDMHQNNTTGDAGQKMRAEVDEKIAKWQEPQQARTKKALPAPDDRPSKKRGGKRARKYKEKFGMTETRKEANKRSFADFSGEYGDDAMGSDVGMLGSKQAGTGSSKLRLPQAKEKKPSVQQKNQRRAVQMSSGATNGLSSSLVFTPHAGMELVGETAAQREAKVAAANAKWFSDNSGFMSARPM